MNDLRLYVLDPRPRLRVVRAPTVAPGSSIGAAAVPSMPGDTDPDEVEGWWTWTMRQVHQQIWGAGSALATGIEVPIEAKDPEATKQYAIDLTERLSEHYGWPVDYTTRAVAAMRSQPPAPTVSATVEWFMPFGPDPAWEGAEQWARIMVDIANTAGMVSAGEASGRVAKGASSLADTLSAYSAAAAARADRALDVADKGAGYAGAALGLGLAGALVGAALLFTPAGAATAAAAATRGRK